MRAYLQQGTFGVLGPKLWQRLVSQRSIRVFMVRSLGMAALFGLEVTLARWLGAAGYGVFSIILAIATIVSRLAPLGWLNAATKFVSAFAGSRQFGLLKGVLITAHAITAIGLIVSVLLLTLASRTWPAMAIASYLPYVIPLMFVLTIVELHRFVLRGLHAGDLGEALPVLILPTLVATAIWVFGISEPQTATYSYGLICLPLILFSTVAIWRRVPRDVWKAPAEFNFRGWSLAALSMLVGSFSDELTARLPVIVLGMLGNEQEAGLYQAAARLALMCVFVLRVVTPIAAPNISVLHQERKFAELRSVFLRYCLTSLIGALPLFFLFLFAAGPVLRLFGSEFVEASGILRLLSFGYLVSAASGPCATALMMIGREKIYGFLAFANLLGTAAACYVLARYFGGYGAAVALASSIAVANLIYLTIFLRATRPLPT